MSDARKNVQDRPQIDSEDKPEARDGRIKSDNSEPALSPREDDARDDVITTSDQELTEELLTDLLKTLPRSCKCGRCYTVRNINPRK